MKQVIRIAAGIMGAALLFGCASQAKIPEANQQTEKIQIIGRVETAAPTAESQTEIGTVTQEPAATSATSESATEAPTAAPTELPTPEPTATPEPTEVPTPEPTEEPTPTPAPTATPEPDRTRAEQFCDLARSFLDYPYYRGGKSPNIGFDPGGFVCYCLNEVGVKVRHKSSKGYSENDDWQRVDSTDDLEPGDLCFFITPGNESVNCVCIYLGDGLMIYPSSGEGKVITNKITGNYWKEAFVFARRVF